MYFVFSRIITLAIALLFITGLASAQAYLTFHIGAGANDQFFVGGTVENRGNNPIARAYVSILPVNERCELLPMAWQEFGPIPAHSKIEFRVPVNSALTQYRLAGFKAFDDMGFALDSVDETANIIKAREHQERLTCQAKRQQPTLKKEPMYWVGTLMLLLGTVMMLAICALALIFLETD